MTTIVVPHIPGMLHPCTRDWATARHARLVALDPYDTEAYWRLLRDEGADPGDLLIVEQDIVPAPGVTTAMLACPHPWCTSPYPIASRQLHDGLGCTKLSDSLKTQHPDLMDRLGEVDGDGLPAKDWRRLDVRLSKLLRGLGYEPHQHAPSEHLHDYRERP
jgi:hypothetical protein